jgi:nucleoside-triphosphatase THEP1
MCRKIILPKDRRQTCVHIIAGEVNTGKTARLLSIYRETGLGDGFINTKIYKAGQHAGQRIVRLSTGESENFSFKKEFIPLNWDEEYSYDVYSFSRRGLMFADKTVWDIIAKGIEPAFIDEIGPLELQQKGFFGIFTLLLKINKEIYITVRDSCVERVIKEFGIEKYQTVKV